MALIKSLSKEAIDDIQNIAGEMFDSMIERNYRAAIAAAAAAASKSVVVHIAEADFTELKDGNYHLCFAKKVGDADYNIIWKALNTKQYAPKNTLSWVPEYQVFATQTFESGHTVTAEYGPVDIGLGQVTTMDGYGKFSQSVDGGITGQVKIINDYASIKFGLAQKCSVSGSTGLLPVFVDNLNTRVGEITMQPRDKIMVWFEAEAETSAIFVNKRSRFIEVELSGTNTKVEVTYEGNDWKKTG